MIQMPAVPRCDLTSTGSSDHSRLRRRQRHRHRDHTPSQHHLHSLIKKKRKLQNVYIQNTQLRTLESFLCLLLGRSLAEYWLSSDADLLYMPSPHTPVPQFAPTYVLQAPILLRIAFTFRQKHNRLCPITCSVLISFCVRCNTHSQAIKT